MFSTLSLLHASSPWSTLWWINSWAELVVPIAYVGALASRAVVAVRLAAAALVAVGPVLGGVGLVIALGYFAATTQKIA